MGTNIQIRQLDRIFEKLRASLPIAVPSRGWLHTIRTALGISLATLAKRTNLTPQAIQGIEKREAEEGITIGSLKSAAEALDCVFVYAIVPRHTLAETVHTAAEQATDAMMKSVTQTMALEDQSIADQPRWNSREELIEKFENNPRLIWRWIE